MEATELQRQKVEESARKVLAVREGFSGSTLADLYDAVAMPPLLAKAHAALDRAVDRCYRKDPFQTDRQRVEFRPLRTTRRAAGEGEAQEEAQVMPTELKGLHQKKFFPGSGEAFRFFPTLAAGVP
jgi:hypothetical protein